jgi:hypothetical protein
MLIIGSNGRGVAVVKQHFFAITKKNRIFATDFLVMYSFK